MAGNDWPWPQIAGHGSYIPYNEYARAGNDWPWVDPGHSWPWPTMASQFPSKACQLQTATRLFSFCKLLQKHVWPGHHPVPAVLGTGFCKLLRKHVWPGHFSTSSSITHHPSSITIIPRNANSAVTLKLSSFPNSLGFHFNSFNSWLRPRSRSAPSTLMAVVAEQPLAPTS